MGYFQKQGLADFFCKKSDSKYVSGHVVSVTPLNSNILARKQSQTICKTCTWLLSTKTFFTKTRWQAGFGQQAVVFSPLPCTRKRLVKAKSEKNPNKETLGRFPPLLVPRVPLQYSPWLHRVLVKVKQVGNCSGLWRMQQTLAHLCGGLLPLTLHQPLSSVLEVPPRAKQSLLELTFWSSKSENEINRCVKCQEVIKAEKENKAALRVDGGGVFVKLSVGWTWGGILNRKLH